MGIQYLSYLVRWSVGNTTKVIYVHIIAYNDFYFRTASLRTNDRKGYDIFKSAAKCSLTSFYINYG